MSYKTAKIVLLGGALVYYLVGNLIFSELHESDFNAAVMCAGVCLFGSVLFLIGYMALITHHHIKILYEKIDEINGEEKV